MEMISKPWESLLLRTFTVFHLVKSLETSSQLSFKLDLWVIKQSEHVQLYKAQHNIKFSFKEVIRKLVKPKKTKRNFFNYSNRQ